jgi:hypothetical protein
MFHGSGLLLDWHVVFVDVHDTNLETTSFDDCALAFRLEKVAYANKTAFDPCGLTSPGVNLNHWSFFLETADFHVFKTVPSRKLMQLAGLLNSNLPLA